MKGHDVLRFEHTGGGAGITSSSSSSLALGGGVDGVYLSSNATPPAGYSSGGSLYRGSGFWVRVACHTLTTRAPRQKATS